MSDTSARAAIIRGLEDSPIILKGLAEEISLEHLHVRRKQSFWSVAEHIVHLAEVQPMILERLQRIKKEEVAEFIPFIPGKQEQPPEENNAPSMTVPEAVLAFASVRIEQVTLLKSLDAAGWAKQAVHPEYAKYGMAILARHILMHDHWHMYRVEELWLTHDEFLTNLEG